MSADLKCERCNYNINMLQLAELQPKHRIKENWKAIKITLKGKAILNSSKRDGVREGRAEITYPLHTFRYNYKDCKRVGGPKLTCRTSVLKFIYVHGIRNGPAIHEFADRDRVKFMYANGKATGPVALA